MFFITEIGITADLSTLVKWRTSLGFSSQEVHVLGKDLIPVVGGNGERLQQVDVIIKSEARAILRHFPALRDPELLLDALGEAVTKNMHIVTSDWFARFKTSNLTVKKRSTSGADRIWKYFERYQEILFNVFGFMYFYPSSALTLGALGNFHNILLTDEHILWPKMRLGKKQPFCLFGINGWFACDNDIPICIHLLLS